MKETEQYVLAAFRHGLITQPQMSLLRKHARHHTRGHMFVMLRLMVSDRKDFTQAHREAMQMVGK